MIDAAFVVKEGATLTYYPNQIYGDNYEFIDDGGTIQTIIQDTKCNDCRCLQEFDYEDDFELPSGYTLTWDSDKIMKGGITVKNGATFRIENATIQFADSEVTGHDFSGIIVEAGGRLELEDATLKVLDGTYCTNKHKFWDGIRLEGLNPQSIEQHAELYAIGATISDARHGVVAIPNTYNDFGATDYWVSGGDVFMANCHFLNNKIGFQILGLDGYPNPSSEFRNCTFEINKLLNPPYFYHAILYSSEKTTFKDCIFKITPNIAEKLEVDERGTGILSYNSELQVYGPPTDANPNEISAFYNLYRAIENYHFGMGKSLRVRDTYFENNLQGITSNASNLDRINDNEFIFNFGVSGFEEDREDENSPSLIYDAWGIYMFGASNYEIRNNYFELGGFDNRADEGDIPNFYGIIGNHAFQSQGLIQGNIFDRQLDNASTYVIYTQTEEDNRFLQIKCNEYYKNEYSNGDRDWLVCPAIGNPDFDNRLENQGTGCGVLSAANLFVNIATNTCMVNTENIEVGTLYKIDNGNTVPLLPFLYWPNGVPNTEGYPDCHDPMQQVDVQFCTAEQASNQQDACPDGGGLPGKANSLVNDYNSVQIAAELKNGTYALSEQVQLIGGVSRIYKEQDRISDAIDFLDAMDTDQSEILLFHLYLQNNLLNEAQSSLTELTLRNLYDVEWYNFYQLLLNVKNSIRGYGDLTSLEIQQIENTANSNSHASISAQSLLGMLQQTTYDRIPQKLPVTSNKRQIVVEEKVEILIFPNPTKGKLNIQIPFEQAEAVIYDLTGKVVQQLVLEKGKNEVEYHLKAGSYFIRFKIDNQFITQKIIILP